MPFTGAESRERARRGVRGAEAPRIKSEASEPARTQRDLATCLSPEPNLARERDGGSAGAKPPGLRAKRASPRKRSEIWRHAFHWSRISRESALGGPRGRSPPDQN